MEGDARRGDEVEAYIKRWRDKFPRDGQWYLLETFLMTTGSTPTRGRP